MNFVKYLIGFFLFTLFTYGVGTLVAWDVNPGNWGSAWRFWCLLWVVVGGHISGIYLKDRK